MIPFQLTILGTNAALPAYGRFTSMQALQVNDGIYLIDCGEGIQIRLAQYKIKRNKIKAIFISHLHGDHLFGLPGLITSFSHHGRKLPLKIYGPKGLKRFVDTVLEVSSSFLTYEIEIIEIDQPDKTIIYQDHNIEVAAFPLKHRVTTYGYLFKELESPFKINKQVLKKYELSIDQIKQLKIGKDITVDGKIISFEHFTLPRKAPLSFAYCSDTIYDPDIVPHIKGVNLLYHETTYLHELAHLAKERMHATSLEAAQIAKAADVGQLVIGHYSGRYKRLEDLLAEAQSIFPDTIMGYDGVMIQV